MENLTKTASRIYYTLKDSFGVFHAYFRPLNPKTGKPWQASRGITKGRDCYILWNYSTKKNTGVIIGSLPAWEDWKDLGWNAAGAGYSTEALALAAIEAEKAKSGK